MKLFDRRPDDVTLTAPGRTLLRHAVTALDALAAAERELKGLAPERGVVRLGSFPTAGALIVPRTLAALRRTQPGIPVTTREATTPALVRTLRAGTIDLAVLAVRPAARWAAETRWTLRNWPIRSAGPDAAGVVLTNSEVQR